MLRPISIVQPDEGNLLAFYLRPLRVVDQVEFLELAPDRDADEVGVSWGVALLLGSHPLAIHAHAPFKQKRQSIEHLPPNKALPTPVGLAIGNEFLLRKLGEVEEERLCGANLPAKNWGRAAWLCVNRISQPQRQPKNDAECLV